MNLEQVAHFINHPNELGLSDASDLAQLVEKHPYASVYTLLYLTALSNGKSHDLDSALQMHAYKISDRTQLFRLLHATTGEYLVSEENIEQNTFVAPPTAVVPEPIIKEVVFEPIVNTPIEKETSSTEIEEEVVDQKTIDITEEEPETTIVESENSNETDEEIQLESEIIPEDLQEIEEPTFSFDLDESSFSVADKAYTELVGNLQTTRLNSAEEVENTEETQPVFEEPVLENEEFSSEVIEFVQEETIEFEQAFEIEVEPSIISTDTEDVIVEEPKEQVDDLVSFENTFEEKIVPVSEPKIEVKSACTTSKRSFTSWLRVPTEEVASKVNSTETLTNTISANKSEEKSSTDAIISQFIKEEPSITRNQTSFYSASTKAKESIDESTLPISETLAKIYAAQGNYPKAIHVYHQLMLAIPEKRTLFAVEIETLKKKISL